MTRDAPLPRTTHGRFAGVQAVWGDDDTGGPLEATLTFRVGESDERLRSRGRCHLVCALVTDTVAVPDDVTLTTSVRALRTRFVVTGPDEAVAETLTAITRALATIRTDRIEHVAPRVRDAWRPPEDWDTMLMSLRFGSRGYGLSALPLLGLDDVDPGLLSEWVREWFSADNAVLATNRRPLVDPDLGALGPGDRHRPPAPRQRDIAFPALVRGEAGIVAVSLLARFDATTRLGLNILIDRIQARCTDVNRSIPRPRFTVRRSGPGIGTVNIAIDTLDTPPGQVRDAVSTELFDLSMRGPTDEELDGAQIVLRRSRARTPSAVRYLVTDVATGLICGDDRNVAAALRARPDDIAERLRAATSRAIWIVPHDAVVTDRRLIEPVDDIPAATEGERFVTRPGSGDGAIGVPVVIGTRSLTAGAPPITVRFDDLVAVELRTDGLAVLWSENGSVVRIRPAAADDAASIHTILAQRIEPWLIIDAAAVSGHTAASHGRGRAPATDP